MAPGRIHEWLCRLRRILSTKAEGAKKGAEKRVEKMRKIAMKVKVGSEKLDRVGSLAF